MRVAEYLVTRDRFCEYEIEKRIVGALSSTSHVSHLKMRRTDMHVVGEASEKEHHYSATHILFDVQVRNTPHMYQESSQKHTVSR
ncbi:hypothetical protein QJS04_geneDACA024843 [Acorus gramineus]|uniref:Uncharacterized protein n=1 Tax=Acorus gramineus TaxID=55184 RepID=A0AAV8ZYB6_ACOGR|nr:hypothetical protein QJS04_geneDACA024843 [Acorus gramineus]